MAPPRTPRNTTENLQVLPLDQLVLRDELQVRVRLDPDTVWTYQQIFRDVPEAQDTCPPITVYRHEGAYVVADGFHRVTAAKRAGRTTLKAFVHTGTLDDAWMCGMTTNLANGLPYTRDDKQKIVGLLLDHPRYGTLSTRDIVALTGHMITHGTVANIRNRREQAAQAAVSKLDTPRTPPHKPPGGVLSNLDTTPTAPDSSPVRDDAARLAEDASLPEGAGPAPAAATPTERVTMLTTLRTQLREVLAVIDTAAGDVQAALDALEEAKEDFDTAVRAVEALCEDDYEWAWDTPHLDESIGYLEETLLELDGRGEGMLELIDQALWDADPTRPTTADEADDAEDEDE